MIWIKTPEGVEHLLVLKAANQPDFEQYAPNSLATREALATAYNRGDWRPYEAPEIESPQPEPNWSDFRLTLMVAPSFRAWGLKLPADWREDLKLAALAANAEALQSVYNHLVSIYTPPPEATAEWQAIATNSHIPVVFQWPRP